MQPSSWSQVCKVWLYSPAAGHWCPRYGHPAQQLVTGALSAVMLPSSRSLVCKVWLYCSAACAILALLATCAVGTTGCLCCSHYRLPVRLVLLAACAAGTTSCLCSWHYWLPVLLVLLAAQALPAACASGTIYWLHVRRHYRLPVLLVLLAACAVGAILAACAAVPVASTGMCCHACCVNWLPMLLCL